MAAVEALCAGLPVDGLSESPGVILFGLDRETFEVDYLDTNLSVRLAEGRQFNFTDPEGDADRLFVFHRDVEKARDRLSRGDPPATD